MDHTLIDNDCDLSWKEFLVRHGIAPQKDREKAERFYQLYCRNELDISAFLTFQLREFQGRSEDEMRQLAQQHFHEVVEPRIYPDAELLISELAKKERILAICTSTNEIIARPIAESFGISNVLATEAEVVNGYCTGRICGTYVSGEGKVHAARRFCQKQRYGLDNVAYYGDSLADVPLLKKVDKAVVINPTGEMNELVEAYGWETREWTTPKMRASP